MVAAYGASHLPTFEEGPRHRFTGWRGRGGSGVQVLELPLDSRVPEDGRELSRQALDLAQTMAAQTPVEHAQRGLPRELLVYRLSTAAARQVRPRIA